jgi:hypothetical protein
MKDINIDSIEIEGIDLNDFPDFCDAFISYAETNDGRQLTISELDLLTENNSSLINELIFDRTLYI